MPVYVGQIIHYIEFRTRAGETLTDLQILRCKVQKNAFGSQAHSQDTTRSARPTDTKSSYGLQ